MSSIKTRSIILLLKAFYKNKKSKKYKFNLIVSENVEDNWFSKGLGKNVMFINPCLSKIRNQIYFILTLKYLFDYTI